MNWITNLVRPRIKKLMTKDGSTRETPENLWRKCSACGEMIFHRDLVANFHVCPSCGHHLRVGPAERFAFTFDPNSYAELPPPQVTSDPLRFKAEKRYADEMKAAKTKTARPEAFSAARGTIDGLPVMIAVQAFDFLGGCWAWLWVRPLCGPPKRRSRKSALSSFMFLPAARACRKACCP